MSLPSGIERQRLDGIADELREAFSERGHLVDVALSTDPAFGSGRSRSSLMNDLVLDTVSGSASRIGVGYQAVKGNGRELIGLRHKYRIRKATRDSEESLVVYVSSESSLLFEEEDTLIPRENWTFGWIPNGDGLIAEVLIAEIRGVLPGTPGRLILGEALPLGSDGPFGDEDEDEGDADGLGA
jgi:hypothetical protein